MEGLSTPSRYGRRRKSAEAVRIDLPAMKGDFLTVFVKQTPKWENTII